MSTRELIYGDLDEKRESASEEGPFQILFVPRDQEEVTARGHLVENCQTLSAFLQGLGLPDQVFEAIRVGLRGSVCWRTYGLVADTAILKQYNQI